VIDHNPAKAEQLLQEAIAADKYYGPAHNNLGVLHFRRGELSAAAQEFLWAQRMMPGHADPRLNLALTLEAAGRVDEALEEYRSALEVHPGHLPTLQAMVRCRLRRPRAGFEEASEIDQQLEEVAMRGDSVEWREWAQRQLQVRPR
jgi:tetratricopeptide (TPR) repeat protein